MARQPADYLGTLCTPGEIVVKNLKAFPTGLTEYATANPVHAAQLRDATARLQEHFQKEKPARPLNSLILGPAGSGKSYLAEQFQAVTSARLEQFNLSQLEHPAEIKACFHQVADALERHPNVIGFFDAFDVRVAGVSAVQHLIQPMYDGKDSKGRSLARAAFLFSGSYLKDRSIYDRVGRGGEGFDLIGFLYDAWVRAPAAHPARDAMRQVLDLTMKYHPIRQQNLPATNALEYVRSLEKINDFLSRINGFVVEVPDLGAPLNATVERYNIALESGAATADPAMGAQLIELVDGLRRTNDPERFLDYRDPVRPILEYKNLILLDRLRRVASLLTRAFGGKVTVERALLNYLTTVPLIHGMRSLSTLVETLDRDAGGSAKLRDDPDLLQRHIADFRHFPTPERVWALIREHNPGIAGKVSDATVTVV